MIRLEGDQHEESAKQKLKHAHETAYFNDDGRGFGEGSGTGWGSAEGWYWDYAAASRTHGWGDGTGGHIFLPLGLST